MFDIITIISILIQEFSWAHRKSKTKPDRWIIWEISNIQVSGYFCNTNRLFYSFVMLIELDWKIGTRRALITLFMKLEYTSTKIMDYL